MPGDFIILDRLGKIGREEGGGESTSYQTGMEAW